MAPKYFLILSVLGWLCLQFVTPIRANHSIEPSFRSLPKQILQGADLSFGFEEQEEAQMQVLINRYAHEWDNYTQKLFGKAIYYFPVFSYHLKAAGLPDALKYLPLIESHLLPEAESPRGARGLWQFMPATARHYGLRVNTKEDDRLDPQLSSAAAATMLSELFETFGDWKLVLAAYNCGPGRVKRAIAKARSTRYEDLKAHLPQQTRQYLRKFSAMLYVGNHAKALGLVPEVNIHTLEGNWEEVPIITGYDLKQLAKLAGLNYEFLLNLNPKGSHSKATRNLILPDYAAHRLHELSTKIHGRDLNSLVATAPVNLVDIIFCEGEGLTSRCLPMLSLPMDNPPSQNGPERLMTWVVLPRYSLLN